MAAAADHFAVSLSFAAPLSGIADADRRLLTAATRLASSADPAADVDIAAEAVALRVAKTQRAASIKVARAISDTLGTLLDTFA
jgi:hypothetical protein